MSPAPSIALQGTLFADGQPAIRTDTVPEHRQLDPTSWVEVSRGWLSGADTLFEQLRVGVAWTQPRRRMYGREVDDPRLSHWYRAGAPLPHPTLTAIRDELASRFDVGFHALGLNYYRDGADSVAFHADRELRRLDLTLVAIITLGAARSFLLRPMGGGRSIDLRPGSGDLVVMGGACQRHWEHAVPKVTYAGPRISVSVRWSSPT